MTKESVDILQLNMRTNDRRLFIWLNIIVFLFLIIWANIYINRKAILLPKSRPKISESLKQMLSVGINARIDYLDQYLKNLSEQSVNSEQPYSYSKLVEPKHIYAMTRMQISKSQCSAQLGADLNLLVFVFNRVDDFDRRQIIRQSWGKDFQSDERSKLYFAVGLSTDTGVQPKLEAEDSLHNDIIQWSYIESYYNCTIKALALLRWTAINCPFVKFIMKADDDTVLIGDKLIQFTQYTNPEAIYGYLWTEPHVCRDLQSSKWAISYWVRV